ncbi:tetratricopeptide repeat protein [uncultured Dokdonia sp.]|uniref:tetratricopeptide repeat protein n=1 Tax=uncultured Dokdonia sp. TaxID=575653 RepID=UPI0026379440|nr:tetratricopeptide repeat protein [uncultured Dokdonia sp.]
MKSIYLVICLCFLFACQEKQITDSEDYNIYLVNQDTPSKDLTTQHLQFWNTRIKEDSIQIIALGKSAQEYTALFETKGTIESLKNAEIALQKAADNAYIGKDTYLRALAKNLISQHRFKDALHALAKAEKFFPNKRATQLMQFDVAMELGDYDNAEAYLKSITDFSDFNYLIRLAKWNDYKGDLDATIHYMEQAKTIAEYSNNEALELWTYTNIADYYGHAGRIQDAYKHYLKSLAIDPNNAYAKKGIAWIAYSHEKNPTEALRILDAIQKQHQSPDYFLLKAEIAEYQNDPISQKEYITAYFEAIKNPAYGVMYNTYTAEILLGKEGRYDEALAIAQQEVENRPTPQSYDLLAYVYQQKGDYKKALDIAEKYVANKTYEPVANYHLAEIYKANGLYDRVAPIKKELLDASYELGPVTTSAIKNL